MQKVTTKITRAGRPCTGIAAFFYPVLAYIKQARFACGETPVMGTTCTQRLLFHTTNYITKHLHACQGKTGFRRIFAPIIIKCTETHMSRLCIFLFISTPKDGGETDGKIPLPDLRGQEEDRGVAPDRRPAGRHRGPPLRPLHHDLQGAPARRDRRAGRKPARGVQRRAGREAAP